MQVYVNESYNIEDQANSCYLHPDGTFVGVCPLCLNEKLIILASLSKQSLYCLHKTSFNFCSVDNSSLFSCGHADKKPVLQKIFSLGSGIFHHLEFKPHKSDDFPGPDLDESVSTSSQEAESYISIKIEDKGFASWEKNNTKQCNKSVTEAEHGKHNIEDKKNVSELELPKAKPTKRLSWHDRIGHACQLIKKKGSMKGWVCHTKIENMVEGVEIRKGGRWLRRTLTKRREPKKE